MAGNNVMADSLKDVEVQALIRFAATFLHKVSEFPATPEGLEAAYSHTLLLSDTLEYDDVCEYMADLSARICFMFPDEFSDWARSEVLPVQLAEKAKNLKRWLSELNPQEDGEKYNRLFGDLVEVERRKRKLESERSEEAA